MNIALQSMIFSEPVSR